VVENVERNIEEGRTPLQAAHQAMKEVSGPIVAIALVLCAVFVPMAFLSGVTGQFYKQFAVTIAISTVISAINSLTLSPALAAKLLKEPRCTEGCPVTVDRASVRVGVPAVQPLSSRPARTAIRAPSRDTLKHRGSVFAVYALLLLATGAHVPSGAARLHSHSGQAVS
jgi:multidrug efflux pump